MPESLRLVVCPGSFDPPTNGHVAMIARAARLFDRVVVAVLANPSKRGWLPVEERLSMLRDVLAASPDRDRLEVDTFDGLLADYVRTRQASAVVRGLRSVTEFADESQMAMMNRHLVPAVETVFLVATPDVAYISSRLVREIAGLGGPLDGLVPPPVAARLARLSTDRIVRV
jgi:pantetheine-phosphate adenylyltransferase